MSAEWTRVVQLPKPFYLLPIQFDAERMCEEVLSMPESAWVAHPDNLPGNSALRLISADGGENNLTDGDMRPTPHLQQMPYIRQILASFGVPWGRSRLLRLGPGGSVPRHADIHFRWFNRVRLHIPVITNRDVRFHCGGASVHMAAGEAWLFDNWRLHEVVNPAPQQRIHLVADTVGNAAFWQLVGMSDGAQTPNRLVRYAPGEEPVLLTERATLRPVMVPAELELLVGNLLGELVHETDSAATRAQLARYLALLDGFVRDWRHYYAIHGEEPAGWREFQRLRDAVNERSFVSGEGIVARTNGISAHNVFQARVLRACLSADAAGELTGSDGGMRPRNRAPRACLEQPVFIVAAPRSGSTLLFETLATNAQFATLGGEAHWLVEGIADLRPGAPGVDSNRLLAAHATEAVKRIIGQQILEQLFDRDGVAVTGARVLRLLEKTPKNALRIPFFSRLFPDARFIFLWREPRGNLSSIIDAWRAGRWQTYPALEGFELPWSLLLPPGWETLRGRPLEELAAFQWNATNRIVMDDLSALPAERWTVVTYEELLSAPDLTGRRLCRFAGVDFDARLAERVAAPLPHARHTLTAPDRDKWRRNSEAIERILVSVEPTWRRLVTLAGR